MKTKILLLFSLGAMLLLNPGKAWSSHITGAELTYSCINACTVRVEFRGYRHCSGTAVVSPNPVAWVPALANCGQPTDLGPWSPEFQTEVVPLCAAFSPTNCTDPNSNFSGIMEHYSFRDYDICSQPNCLYTIEWSTCCRNAAINSGAANEGMYIGSTTLNTSLTPCNNSPQFTNDPVFYICGGRPTLAAQGAFDPDGDSLAYSLGPCRSGAVATSTYAAGFSAAQPLGPSWTVSINPVTGDVLFSPNPGNSAVGIICLYVEEYRNGILINTLVRDMQVSVLPCPVSLVCQTFNVVEGTLYQDDNNNCTADVGESAFGGTTAMVSNPGGFMVPVNPNGEYRFYLPQGTFDLAPVAPANGYWQTTCPPSGVQSVNFSGVGDTLAGRDFGIDVLVECPDMWVSLATGPVRPCVDVTLAVAYANIGTDTAFGASVELQIDTAITFLSASMPVASVAGNLFTFSLGDLAPGETGAISILGNVLCNASITGNLLCNEAHIYPDSSCLPANPPWSNYIDEDCRIVVNSFDPNSKRVSPVGIDPQFHYIDSTDVLEYFIDFQNTGTAYALEVVIEDTLDARLDLNTMVPGASSHPYTWEVASDRRLRFVFSNINLPTEAQDSLGSIGFVKFAIQMLPGLNMGDRIENTANIYFDINAPIRTNTVFNTVGWPAVALEVIPEPIDVRLYPNPANNKVYAEVMGLEAGTPLNFELHSLLGQKVFSGAFLSESRWEIDLDRIPGGVYIYRVLGSGGLLKAGKLVKQ